MKLHMKWPPYIHILTNGKSFLKLIVKQIIKKLMNALAHEECPEYDSNIELLRTILFENRHNLGHKKSCFKRIYQPTNGT